ncbi:hypothetical protein J0K78_03270 [Halobacillus sp. GSS1]|uniref:hypothetical protein n=1 Tax=Halobacillus sp. GSS1 TaxID=2815919 RepID=UPI001A8E212B|nr:hypothetical protein [Halobacillus sp. GSS1]MBN9653274.1 hypothetical protein [Halobacillus sp. GSS1]
MGTLYHYNGLRPEDDLVKETLKLDNSDYVYITATGNMAKEREDLIPDGQKFNFNHKGEEKKALFDNVLKGWIQEAYPGKLAGALEERTFLLRAIGEVASNEKERQLMRKDYSSILKALKELEEKKIRLTYGIPHQLQDELLDPLLGSLLPSIQKQFYHELKSEGKFMYEQLALYFINNTFIHKFGKEIKVVMEGFTFLKPLQQELIDVCLKNNINISLIVPFNDNQKGFDIIKRTYSCIPGLDVKWISSDDNNPISTYKDLRYLQKEIFKKVSTPYAHKTENIFIKQYMNRDYELFDILKQIEELIKEGYSPTDIAIVFRRRNEFIYRLSDLLELHPIQYKGENISLPVSPRMLLLTPVGRFILTLYDIWEDNELKIDADQLETLLGSGWLGAKKQSLTPKFRAVKYQVFSNCSTKGEWIGEINSLYKFCRTNTLSDRISIKTLDNRVLDAWKEVIELLEKICSKLFDAGSGSIGEHIERLRDQLFEVIPKDLRRTERAILDKIMEVFEELEEEYSIDLDTEEFSEILHALVSNKDENDEGDEDGEDSEGESELKVYSPETIDNIHKPVVIFASVDNQHVPSQYMEGWPFYKDERNEHLEKERYMFLTAIRAAQDRLIFSYSLQDSDRSYQPSAYVRLVAENLNVHITKFETKDIVDMESAPHIPTFPEPNSADRRTYELSELAHYGLCPARYRLELLHPEARSYRMEWQLQYVAQSEWVNQVLQKMLNERESIPYVKKEDNKEEKKEELKKYFLESINSVEENVRKMFSALSPTTWHGIKNQVNSGLINYHYSKRWMWLNDVLGESQETIEVYDEKEDEVIDIKFTIPYFWKTYKFDVPILDHELNKEWLLPADSNSSTDLTTVNGVQHFSSLKEAVSWWRNTIVGFFYENKGSESRSYNKKAQSIYRNSPDLILEWISAIQSNKFSKNPGDHCKKCPVRLECLGIATESEET